MSLNYRAVTTKLSHMYKMQASFTARARERSMMTLSHQVYRKRFVAGPGDYFNSTVFSVTGNAMAGNIPGAFGCLVLKGCNEGKSV